MATSTPGSASPLEPGATFHGRYRVVRCLKAGAMGAVYEVLDHHTASARALKVMLPSLITDLDLHTRFVREARITGAIDSDHLVRVSDSGVDEATRSPFLVMDLLRGEDLADLLWRRTRLPAGEVITYLTQAGWALDKTHGAGIVHRDLKPPNLFLTLRDDGSPCIKILDFGIAKVVAAAEAQSTRAIGTPMFMAPEQILGEGAIGPAADIYALAHVAYAMLVGEAYWKEESNATDSIHGLLMKIAAGAAEPASARARRRASTALPPAFDAWFAKATAPHPEHRFDRASAAMAAMADALTGAAAPGPAPAPHAPPPVLVTLPTPYAAPMLTAAMPPPPAARAPVGPPGHAPRTLLFALAAVGVLLVACLALGAYFVFFSDRGALSSCMPGAVCTPLDVDDPTHVDAQAIYGQVEKAARAADSRAALTYLSITGAGRHGAVDVTRDGAILYQFTTPTAVLAVAVNHRRITVSRGPLTITTPAIPAPACSVKSAWKAAVGAGLPAGATSTIVYKRERAFGDAPTWMVGANLKLYSVDAVTCTIRGR